MYQPPLHRRILPWLYVFIFVAVAPLLIFYTAGYRYNPKKNVIEHNGSLIIDSVPRGAQIIIDGVDTNEVTPITLQNMTPGTHHILVGKDGYQSWQKDLEVRTEQVTFANAIWLWKTATPTFLQSSSSTLAFQADEQADYIAWLQSSATSTRLDILTNRGDLARSITLPNLPSASTVHTLSWSSDGRAVLIENNQHVADTVSFGFLQNPKLTVLSPGDYGWNGTSIVNHQNATSVIDGLSIRPASTSTSSNLILVDSGILSNSYALPPGHWHIEEVKRPFVVLRDQNHWLAIQLKKDSPFAGELDGDEWIWMSDRKQPTALVKNGNEIWYWQLGEAPQLLWRLGEPLIDIGWHADSQQVMIATKTSILAIDLDERGGRLITPLTQFDQIDAFAVTKTNLMIAGTRQGKKGIWLLAIE